MAAGTELTFHPDAAVNFRERGQRLLASVKPIHDEPSTAEFKAERHPTVTLTEKDITHLGPRQTIDPLTMEVSEIAFATPDGKIGLDKEGCIEVDRLSEAIQKTSSFRPRVSRKFLRDALIDWLEAHLKEESQEDLPDFVLGRANAAIHVFEIWVPLANLAVEREVRLDPVRVRPLSKEALDTWFDSVRHGRAPEDLAQLEPHLEKVRAEIQGLAAVHVSLRAERQQSRRRKDR